MNTVCLLVEHSIEQDQNTVVRIMLSHEHGMFIGRTFHRTGPEHCSQIMLSHEHGMFIGRTFHRTGPEHCSQDNVVS